MNLQPLLRFEYISRFLSVGAVGAVFDNLVLLFTVEMIAIPPVLAKALSAELAIVLMFLINERWTFSGHGNEGHFALLRRFLTSNFVRLGGLVVGLVALYILHNHLGLWYLLANVLGIGLGFVVNYVFESVFTWRVS